MWEWLKHRFRRRSPHIKRLVRPRVVLTDACLQGIAGCLKGSLAACHEGVVYLLGSTDGETTLAVTSVRPDARTTAASFEVSAAAMARVVRAANDLSLHVVGQVHTHPGAAAHSDGDVAGARMKYPGYTSIVVPEYGRFLPALDGAAVYSYTAAGTFVLLDQDAVLVVPGSIG